MSKYTKEDMLGMEDCKTGAQGRVICTDCPYGDSDEFLNEPIETCLEVCNEKYRKERGLKIDSIVIDELPTNPFEDKPFTLESLAYAIQNGLKIRRKEWRFDEFIMPSDDKKTWIDEKGVTFDISLRYIENWRFYKDPPKTEEVKFYRPITYNEDTGVIDPLQYFKKSKDDFKLEPQFIVVSWEEATFQIPVGAKLCTPKKK
jgi:hypothetical protein